MSKFKTTHGEMYRSATGNLKVLSKENDFLYKVEVALLNNKTNRNNWRYENLDEHKHLFADTPILVAYVAGGLKVGDGHNFTMKYDENGDQYASFTDGTAERIVGWFRDADKIRIEDRYGTKWIVAEGQIWAWYSHELVQLLDAQGASGMEVSIETLVENVRYDGDTEVYDNYKVLGTTILGSGVQPAVAGANIRALTNMGKELEKLKLKVAAYEKETAPKTKKSKGVKTILNVEQIQKMFVSYKVLAVNGSNVCLLSKNGTLATYMLDSEEAEINEAKIKPAKVTSVVTFDDESTVEINVAEVVENFALELINNKAELTSTLKSLNDMKAKEHERRKQLVIDSITARFDEIKESLNEDLDANECGVNEIKEAADEYAKQEDESGEFIGEKNACDALLAKCMSKYITITKNAKKPVFNWSIPKNDAQSETGIAAVLSRINK